MPSNGPFYARGVYRGVILDQGLTKASTGTVQVVLKIRVLEGVAPACDVEAQYERTLYLPATDKTMEYLVPKLAALGYTRDSLRFLDTNNSQCHDMRGTEAEFFCKHENDRNGDLRERWDVATGGGSKPLELKPPEDREMRQLDMLFGRARKATGAATPKPAAARPSTTEDGITDSDIPF